MGRGQPAPYRSADTHTPPPREGGELGGGLEQRGDPRNPPPPPSHGSGYHSPEPRSHGRAGAGGAKGDGVGGSKPRGVGERSANGDFFFHVFCHFGRESVPTDALLGSA